VLACCPTAWVDGFRVAHGAAAGVGVVGVINWKGVRGTTGIAKLGVPMSLVSVFGMGSMKVSPAQR